MTAHTPLRFGIRNTVPSATLTATPTPNTTLDWLKDESRARLVVWTTPGGDITISGTLSEYTIAEFFALPGADMLGHAEVQLELFDGGLLTADVLGMGFVQVAHPVSIGAFRAGIDKYGMPRDIDKPTVFIHWLDRPYVYDSFKLTIRQSEYATAALSDVRLRMLIVGQKIEMDYNFEYGSPITFVTKPSLVQTEGGSWVQTKAQVRSRAMSLTLPQMSDSDRENLWALESELQGSPLIVSAFPTGRGWQFNNHSYLARFGAPIEFSQTFEGIHRTTIQLLEV